MSRHLEPEHAVSPGLEPGRIVSRRPGSWRLLALAALALATALAAAPLLVGTGALLARGLPALGRALLGAGPQAEHAEIGLPEALAGSLLLAAGATLLATPVGIAAAIRLSELPAEGPLARATRWAIRELSGVPSVCVGLMGLALLARALGLGPSPAAAVLTLAVLVLPTIVAATEEALAAAPAPLREASLALGASRTQTLARLVLPHAFPRIAAGALAAAARAAGATAPLLFVLGVAGGADVGSLSPATDPGFARAATLPTRLMSLALDGGSAANEAAHATAAALVLLVVTLHAAAALLRARAARREAAP